MANTVSLISYNNTFGDWVVATNSLIKENNDLSSNNYVKGSGTLFLNAPTLGLQIANNAIIGGQLQVQGAGSGVYVQRNMRLDGTLSLSNTTLSLNSGPVVIVGTLSTSNTATFGASVEVTGNTTSSNVVVDKTVTATDLYLANTMSAGNTILTGNLSCSDIKLSNYLIARGANLSSLQTIGAVSVGSDLSIGGQLSVGGNFALTGIVVYDTNSLILNAGSSVGMNSYLGVNRGTTGSNAEILWNETADEWQIKDVNNPGNYHKIMTGDLRNDSISTANSVQLATPQAVKIVNDNLVANVVILNNNVTANVIALNAFIESSFAKANTLVNSIVCTSGKAYQNANSITFTSTNGVVTVGSGNTVTINTAQDIRVTASPTFAGLTITTTPISISSGGTGGNNRVTSLTNLLPPSPPVDAVLTANNTGHYVWRQNYANTAAFTSPYGLIPAGNNTVQLAIQDLENRKATISNPVFTNLVLSPNPPLLSSNTQVATTYFVQTVVRNNINIESSNLTSNITNTISNVSFYSVAAGTRASNNFGEIVATGKIISYYSDERLKNKLGNIENALDKVMGLNGFYYEPNDVAQNLGYELKREVGMSAQEVQSVLPEIINKAPVNDNYLTIQYERLVPLLIEAIKELKSQVDELKNT